MEYQDNNEYQRRVDVVGEIVAQHPELLKAMTASDRELLEQYFLDAQSMANMAEYRVGILKDNPDLELQANKAYERFLAEAGIPEMLDLS